MRAAAGLLLAAAFAAWTATAEAAGPWRGRVVDAETDRPLAGVIVLAVWDKISPGIMHPARQFYDVDEVITDAAGRFQIPARRLLMPNPFVSLDGPAIYMFKAGYGARRIRAAPGEGMSNTEWRKRMATKGIVFELPPAKSPEERRAALASPPLRTPQDRIPKFMEAIDDEAERLGIPTFRDHRPGGKP